MGDLGLDVVNGGAGNDQFVIRDAEGADKIDGGAGIDAIEIVPVQSGRCAGRQPCQSCRETGDRPGRHDW